MLIALSVGMNSSFIDVYILQFVVRNLKLIIKIDVNNVGLEKVNSEMME